MSIEIDRSKEFIAWINTKTHLNTISSRAATRFVNRGDVYWCHFGLNIGSEMSKSSPRPAIIVQNYMGNYKSPNTIVVPVTHDNARLPCLVPLTAVTDETGNTLLDGQANTSNIMCVSKARLTDKITSLSKVDMEKIDESIARSLELMPYYIKIKEKYDKLLRYNVVVKKERNVAQDTLSQVLDLMNTENISDELLRKNYIFY